MQVGRVEHTPVAVEGLIDRIAGLEPDPAEVRVVLETRHGLLVEALIDAGFTVLPVNPDLVARRRGPARKKDDAEDARICCLLAVDRHAGLKALIPHGELGGELRAIARDDDRAARDQRRLLNRLRADLQTTYPAALVLAGQDLGAPTVLRLLERWPTPPELAAASHAELVEFARAGPRRRATTSGLTGTTVNPASISASTSRPWRVSSTTRTSAGSGSRRSTRSISAPTPAGVCSTRNCSMTPFSAVPRATSWNSSAQSMPIPSTCPSPSAVSIMAMLGGPGRRCVVLMNQSS